MACFPLFATTSTKSWRMIISLLLFFISHSCFHQGTKVLLFDDGPTSTEELVASSAFCSRPICFDTTMRLQHKEGSTGRRIGLQEGKSWEGGVETIQNIPGYLKGIFIVVSGRILFSSTFAKSTVYLHFLIFSRTTEGGQSVSTTS